jgi:hypothetical protein
MLQPDIAQLVYGPLLFAEGFTAQGCVKGGLQCICSRSVLVDEGLAGIECALVVFFVEQGSGVERISGPRQSTCRVIFFKFVQQLQGFIMPGKVGKGVGAIIEGIIGQQFKVFRGICEMLLGFIPFFQAIGGNTKHEVPDRTVGGLQGVFTGGCVFLLFERLGRIPESRLLKR